MNTTRGLKNITPYGGPQGHPNYEANLKKFGTRHPTEGRYLDECAETCCYCGKYVKNPKTFALLEDVALFVTKEQLGDFDLGQRPVGSECAKVLKKAGVKLYNWDFEEV